MQSWLSLAFSALFVEHVVAIWSVVTEDTHRLLNNSTLIRTRFQLSHEPAETIHICQIRGVHPTSGLERNKSRKRENSVVA